MRAGAPYLPAGEKGVLAIVPALLPGMMSTLWEDDDRLVQTYFSAIPNRQIYSTFDWGMVDEEGYHFILGRTDDVINVAGHRLGTREIEEAVNTDTSVAECAAVGVSDSLKGQAAVAFVVLKRSDLPDEDESRRLSGAIMQRVQSQRGAFARPSRVLFVPALPKTRSRKVVRRAIVALCEGRDPGDLSTIEDPQTFQFIKDARS